MYFYAYKKNVNNKAKVEGSICSAYLVEEAANFCSYIFSITCTQNLGESLIMMVVVLLLKRLKVHFQYSNIPVDHLDE